jgi:phosphoribosyl 1,2-cyclic phosphodiesterase
MDRGEAPEQGRPELEVRIWGARGSVPTPVARNLRVGGNTSCIEVCQAEGQSLVFDAGTGIRMLGLASAKSEFPQREWHVFLTHFHWDHLQGLPFFPPLYSPETTITFHSACPAEELRSVLEGQMTNPYFPVRLDLVAAELKFEQLTGPVRFGQVEISSFPLHHPGGACGFVAASGGARVVYATDHEHGDEATDEGVVAAAKDADVLIYDAQFTPEEYPSHKGWGHSTWSEGVRVAEAAGVKRLVLFHHDPAHSDEEMGRILEAARARFPETLLAIEGMRIAVGVRP